MADKDWAKKNPEKHAAKQKRWADQNRDKARESDRRWREQNPEKARESDRRWKEENRERARETSRQWRERNRDRLREAQREWRAANPEKVRERSRRQREADPERHRELQRQAAARRRAALFAELLEAYGGACTCCGEANPKFLSLEHRDGGHSGSRRKTPRASLTSEIVRLRAEGWPDTCTILCFNCNQGTSRNGGVCPHQE